MKNDSVKKAYLFFTEFPGLLKTKTSTIAQRLNVSEEDVSSARKYYRNKQTLEVSSKTNFEEVAKDKNYQTEYKKFLEDQGIDESEVSNVYFKEKANGVRFTVQLKKNNQELPRESIIEEVVNAIKDYSPTSLAEPVYNNLQERVCVVNLFDAHIDKISFSDTTDKNQGLHKNIKDLSEKFYKLLKHVKQANPERIIFPVGNDFWQTNDLNFYTKKGTEQTSHTHANIRESFREGIKLLRLFIDHLSLIAPVDLLFIKGNHDEDKIFHLKEVMKVIYENNINIIFHDSFKQRQYVRYGDILFGFAHGNNEKVDGLVQNLLVDPDAKKHWSEIKHSVFFLGHTHRESKYSLLQSKDFKGINIKYLRSSEQTEDSWHWDKGYNGNMKSLYCFVYSKDGEVEQEIKVTF